MTVRLSKTLIIMLLFVVGFLMVYGAATMRQKDVWLTRILILFLGIACLLVSGYLLLKIFLPGL